MLNDMIDSGSLIEFVLMNNKLYQRSKNKNKADGSAVISGICTINEHKAYVLFMDKTIRMGTMGVMEGEKIALSFEFAARKHLPVIAIIASGGVRVEEGTKALMQMLKTIITVKKHSKKKLLYIAVVTNPTLGGVSASFVSLADIIIAESNAIFGFTGKRIIEESTRENLPDDFQTSNFAMKHGMVDMVLPKNELKQALSVLLKLH